MPEESRPEVAVIENRSSRAKRGGGGGGLPPLLTVAPAVSLCASVCARLVDSLTPDGSTVTSKSELSCVSGACGTRTAVQPRGSRTLYAITYVPVFCAYVL